MIDLRPAVHYCRICESPTPENRTFTDDGIVIVSWPCACGFVDHVRLSFSQASRPHAGTTAAGGDCLPTVVAVRSDDRRSA